MSRQFYRTNSAGGSVKRLGSAGLPGSARSDGRASENQMLREQVANLQHELLLSKAEAQKVTDQLSCLSALIKRAWTGDKTANIHVANIVGVAPPDFITETDRDVNKVNVGVTAKLKLRVVNHWAVLTIGLLNREYRRMEKELEAKQLFYFQRRQDYLEEQLLLNRDQMIRFATQTLPTHAPSHGGTSNSPTHTPHTDRAHTTTQPHSNPAHNSMPHEPQCTSPIEGLSGRTEPVQTHRYGWQQAGVPNRITVNKPPSPGLKHKTSAKYRMPQAEAEVELTWADLVIEPLHTQKINKSTNMAIDCLYRLPKGATESEKEADAQEEEFDEDRIDITYDDPNRYASNGLFNAGETLGGDAASRAKHPLSRQMKRADSLRARPKSAVVKQERSLKYETTRPISAPKATRTLNNNRKQSPNHNQKTRQYMSMDKVAYERNLLQPDNNADSACPTPNTRSARDPPKDIAAAKKAITARMDEEFQQRKVKLLLDNPGLAELINVDVTQPECIKGFDEELQAMQDKEKDFKKRALELQKKLGIRAGGILYPDL